MADRTTNKFIEMRAGPNSGNTKSYPIADGVTVAIGTLVQLEAGYLNHWDDGAISDLDTFVGIVVGGDSYNKDGIIIGETTPTNNRSVPRARVAMGQILVGLDSVNGPVAQTSVGLLVYCSDSDTDNMDVQSSGNTNAIGWVNEFRSTTDIDVRLFTPEEFLAFNRESPGSV